MAARAGHVPAVILTAIDRANSCTADSFARSSSMMDDLLFWYFARAFRSLLVLTSLREAFRTVRMEV